MCSFFLPQFLVLACCAGALFTAEVLCSWYFQRRPCVTNVQDHCPPALFQFKRSTTTLQVPHWHRVFIIKKNCGHYMTLRDTHMCFSIGKKEHTLSGALSRLVRPTGSCVCSILSSCADRHSCLCLPTDLKLNLNWIRVNSTQDIINTQCRSQYLFSCNIFYPVCVFAAWILCFWISFLVFAKFCLRSPMTLFFFCRDYLAPHCFYSLSRSKIALPLV